MVSIVNYQKRTTEEGKEFFTLELQGGIEVVKSQETGKLYMTARKAKCEAYEYTIKDTGEVITLSHRFEYVEQEAPVQTAEKSKTTIEEFMSNAPSGNSFSTNGQLVH